MRILIDWEQLAKVADSAQLPVRIPGLRAVPKSFKKLFLSDFRRNCAKLSKMIKQLTVWIQRELVARDEISILGI